MSENQDEKLVIGGQEFSLAQLAGMDVSDYAEVEYGFAPLNRGGYNFRISDAGLGKVGEEFGAIQFTCEVIACNFAADDAGNPMNETARNELLGRKQTMSFFINSRDDTTQDEAGETFKKGVGKAKKFLSDIGYSGKGSLQQILDGAVGKEFTALIKHSRSKKDADKVYVNFANVKALAAAPSGGLKIG